MDIAFKKVIDEFGGEILLVFEYGRFGQPLCIFDRFAIKELRKELESFKEK